MIQFFTVVTTNYLPFAVSLLDSVKAYHPEFQLCICLADYLDPKTIEENRLMSKYPILQLHEIDAEEFDFITTTYNSMQLSNCSKILFAQHLLKQDDVDQVIFGDSDMLFFNKLPSNVFEGNANIFTPHFSSPPPLEMKRQELEVLNAGLINGGFFRLKKSDETYKFISWIRARSVKDCLYDFKRGYYGEQLWLNFVSLYFKNVLVDKNYGLNVAYWNLHERIISKVNNQFMVNDNTPLSFFHFSGWDYNKPLNISNWALFNSEMRPDVIPLLLKYKDTLQKNEYQKYIDMPNFYTSNNKSQKKSLLKKLKNKLFLRKS
jgi:hypothetical protein